jgi:hypothetical protein
VSLTFDPARERYLALFKVHSTPADGYRGSTPNAPAGYRRLVGQSVSYDGHHWSPARRIVTPDAGDEGVTEFYSIGGVAACGELLVGFLRVLRDDLAAEPDGPVAGIGYTVLAWSRDGEYWQRDREPFLDRNAEPDAFDRAMAWADAQLDCGEETLLYYGGYARGHKVARFAERQLGVARMKRGRYVAREAGEELGWLLTPPLILAGRNLTINANVRGDLTARALSAEGEPLLESAPVRGDSVTHAIRWPCSLERLASHPIRLELRLRKGRVYGFEVR